jgi:HK97 family phage major capsid protein
MTLRELQEKRESLVVAARERLDQINANTDESRAAELETQHDAAMAELDKLDRQIAREQRVAEAERSLEERADSQRPHEPNGQRRADEEQRGDDRCPIARPSIRLCALAGAGWRCPRPTKPARSFARGYHRLPPEQRAQTTTNSAGGYTVPTELQAEIIRAMKLRVRCTTRASRANWSPAAAPMPWPTVDDTANSASGTTQGTTLTDDGSGDATFGQKQLDAFAFATPWLRISKELMDDSIVNIESVIGDLLGERLGRIANTQLTTGSGSSAPNGIVTATLGGQDGGCHHGLHGG